MGDAVFGVAPGCLGEAVVGPAQLLALLPPSVSFADAATIPTTYATVLAAFDGGNAMSKDRTVRAACMHASFLRPSFMLFQIAMLAMTEDMCRGCQDGCQSMRQG